MSTDLRAALTAHFAPTDIEWRIGQAGKKVNGEIWAKAFAYITNRAIQDRLDAVVGPAKWKNEYKEWTIGTAGVLCGISLLIDSEWVTKWDGAEQTDMEPVKGGLSGAMKRAAVQWGIGRYLYDLPEGWARVSEQGAHYASQVKIKVRGAEERITFRWDPPILPKWAHPEGGENGHPEPELETRGPERQVEQPAATEAVPARGDVDGPTEKQVAFYRRLADSPVFTEDERKRALEWFAAKATKQTIKDQIDWLKRQIETRQQARAVRDAIPMGYPESEVGPLTEKERLALEKRQALEPPDAGRRRPGAPNFHRGPAPAGTRSVGLEMEEDEP